MTSPRLRVELIVSASVAILVVSASRAGAAVPEVWRDDADLHAVHFVGRAVGWAVGDHGMALRTVNGGQTWDPRPISADVSLRSAHFLTDKVGWVAGGTTAPFTRFETGIVFATQDGGETWKQVNSAPVTRFHAIQFFGTDEGIGAGSATPECPSGVLTTADGGVTWQAVQTGTVFNPSGWRAAAFSDRTRGAVVGARGRASVVGDGQLLASRGSEPGLRALRAVTLAGPLEGWAVGDGGMILRTENGGLVWQDPAAVLPGDARDLFDFRAVSAVGDKVWVAGTPGSAVWHSPDGGRSWRAQETRSPLPIHAVRFTTEADGVVAGAMGVILRTADGGATWSAVRGADRRAALLAIATTPDRLSFPLFATFAGDQGYRSVALLPVRPDLGAGGVERPNLDLRLHDAVTAAGANGAIVDWPLPLDLPGIDREQDALVAEWNRRTEGRLKQVLVGRLVAALRTWRPEVVVLEQPLPEDAAGRLVAEAARLAIDAAGDATQRLEQRKAGLAPWRVKKLYVRTPGEETADAAVDPDDVLPRLGATAADLADYARSRIAESNKASSPRENYRLVPISHGPRPPSPLFGGLALAPGSEARRAVGEPTNDPSAAALAARLRNIRALLSASDDPRQSAGLLAQIDELSAGLSPAHAARQLHLLAESYLANSRWDLAEQVCVVLVERYPHEPPSRSAMKWLLQLWTGAEPCWLREKGQGTTTERRAGSVETLQARIEAALRLSEEGASAETADRIEAAGLGPDPLVAASAAGAIRIDATRRWEDAEVVHRWQQALRLGGLIRRVDPALFSTPEVQFPLATLIRDGGGSTSAYLRRFVPDLAGGWQPAGAAELTLARPDGGGGVSTAHCGRIAVPPRLDAVLSDPCWQAAKEIRLSSDPAAPLPDGGIVLAAHDEGFLYFAASIPRVPGRPAPTIELAGRVHDEDLSSHDRLVVSLDVDRDYSTSFRFAVDQRGRTAEDCWGNAAWNPKWFAAADGEDGRWRVEAAIPFDELGPRPPSAGQIWAVSFARVAPAVGVQGWPRPNDGEPRAESFGLMRFE